MAKHLKITVEGKVYDVIVEDVTEDAGSSMYPAPGMVSPASRPAAPVAPVAAPAAAPAPAAAGASDKTAPMGGVVIEITVKEGDSVKAGDQVAVIEAMKMKQVIVSDHDGTVSKIHVKAGDAVDAGQPLMTIS
ncbi:MAG: biotin/lipoyl-binding protein [Rhodospirillales bacterium]|nr:biotin/lipoyl-binding protein [Rhodospirillales bacterium]